jgi:hypothetical protein
MNTIPHEATRRLAVALCLLLAAAIAIGDGRGG